MPLHVAIAALLTTPATVPYRLFVNNVDVLKRSDGSGVALGSVQIEYAGSGDPAALRFSHDDPAKAFTIPGHAEVRLWNQATDADEFGGYLMGRTSKPGFGQQGRETALVATDRSIILDQNLVTAIAYPAGLSDRAIIQGLLGNFCVGNLTSSAANIDLTNSAMPAMRFEMQTLRSALDQVAVAAAGDGLGERTLYVTAAGVVRYFRTSSASAPYVVTDAPAGAGQVAPQDLTLVDDDSGIRTAVYVRGANAAGSGWETNGAGIAAYGWRAGDPLDAPDSDSRLKRATYGQSFLAARSVPVRRGSFFVVGTTGWAPGQNVTITNAALGLAAVSFLVKHVTGTPLGGAALFRHDIEFGARRPRFSASLISTIRRR